MSIRDLTRSVRDLSSRYPLAFVLNSVEYVGAKSARIGSSLQMQDAGFEARAGGAVHVTAEEMGGVVPRVHQDITVKGELYRINEVQDETTEDGGGYYKILFSRRS